jgi:SAM-dependent methyltransferase
MNISYRKVIDYLDEYIGTLDQKTYDAYYETNHPFITSLHNCHTVLKSEKDLIDRYRPRTLLDIGCFTGIRLFRYLIKYNRKVTPAQRIVFAGLEKSQRIYDHIQNKRLPWRLPWKNNIFHIDITTPGLRLPELERFPFPQGADMASMLGISFSGIHTISGRSAAFRNIAALLKPGGYFLMDAVAHPGFFQDPSGQSIRLFDEIPIQYFPSRPELITLGESNGLKLIDTRQETLRNKLELYFLLLQRQ